MTNVLGIITARGGSSRVPRKNIKDFLGKPLMAWSIEVGKESGVLDRFILSTEDEEIADVGRSLGVEVPFLRPAEFAQDASSSFDPVKHAYEWMRDNSGFDASSIILLEPPAPGRQPSHIREVVERIGRDDVDSVLGITELSSQYHPEKIVKKDTENMLMRYHDGKLIRESIKRSQEFSKLYFPNASIYAFKPANFYKDPPSLWGDRVYGYEMEAKYAFDIDTPDDWVIAEIKMRRLLDEKAGSSARSTSL